MQFETYSAEQTQKLAPKILNGTEAHVFGLIGDLGAGKTTFMQGVGDYLKILAPITSPTFLILKIYAVTGSERFNRLVHIDAYRISSWDEISMLGIEEMWNDPKTLVCIEWADRIKQHLPEDIQYITFEHTGEDKRTITVGLAPQLFDSETIL